MAEIIDKVKKTVSDIKEKPLEVNLQSMPVVKNMYMRIVERMTDKDKQQQSLTRAYVGAFSIIAVLSIIGHLLTIHINNNQRESAEITFTITNMRSLVDTVVSQATAFKVSGDSFDDDMLTQALDHIKNERARIDASGSEDMKELFRDPQMPVDDDLQKFITITSQFMRDLRTNQRDKANASYGVLTGESARVLEIHLDLALQQFRADVLAQIERASQMQTAALLIILLVLILEALFIFSPLARQLSEYHKYLIKLALTDVLTGLNNRRAFMQLANAGLDHYHRHKKPFCLVLMDLDHFKSVNDTYGHKVGDLVLQHYASLTQKILRAHDTVGRIGGEEFSIFLPQTTAEEALPMLERFRRAVAETPCPYVDGNGQQKTLNYSSSFGVVAVSSGVWTLDELIIRADENLYKAKERGRNCVVLSKLPEAAKTE